VLLSISQCEIARRIQPQASILPLMAAISFRALLRTPTSLLFGSSLASFHLAPSPRALLPPSLLPLTLTSLPQVLALAVCPFASRLACTSPRSSHLVAFIVIDQN
jgi:hypothetical protein